MPERGEREVLVLRGTLDRAGRFTPRRMRSTPVVRQWPVHDPHERGSLQDVRAELLDGNGEVLHREPAHVTRVLDCAPGDPQQYRLLAYIELRPDAEAVRLVREDLVLWQERIPEPARLELALQAVDPRTRSASLALTWSEPVSDGAHLMVVHAWGEGRFETIYVGPPQERLDLDLTEWPGGDRCRLAATYSNGMRSAQVATDSFELPLLGPTLTVARPTPGEQVMAGTPVVLEGSVLDRERPGGPRPDDELWWSIDGETVARGPIASVDALAEGGHVVALRYRPGDTDEEVAATELEVRALRGPEPLASDWADWDPLV